MRPGTVPDTTPTRKENSVRGQVFIRLLPQCHLPLLPLSGSFRAPEFLPALKRAVLSNPTAGEWNRPGHTPLLLTSLPVSKRAGGGTCPSSVSFKLHIHAQKILYGRMKSVISSLKNEIDGKNMRGLHAEVAIVKPLFSMYFVYLYTGLPYKMCFLQWIVVFRKLRLKTFCLNDTGGQELSSDEPQNRPTCPFRSQVGQALAKSPCQAVGKDNLPDRPRVLKAEHVFTE